MTEGIGGQGPISPELRATYKQEFAHSVDLFKRSLTEYENAHEAHKKDMFKDVMAKALNVMNETAQQALNKSALNQKTQLEQDYQNFLANATPENTQKLNKDIQSLERSL